MKAICYDKPMVIGFGDLEVIRKHHENQTLVLTSGTFDLLHVGHLAYLKDVKQYGDVLVVLLSGDARVKARKGNKRPIINESDRAQMLDNLKLVDYVLIDPSKLSPEETDPIHKEIIDKLNPDYYVTDGADPRFINILERKRFIILDRSATSTSTTGIINHIAELYR